MSGTLYIVATPMGNLEDITLRALRVLKEVDLIAAEDTRHTQGLLSHFGIRTQMTSYHDHNEAAKAPQVVERLRGGESVALVSDAGTPAISDPGYRLVVEAIAAGIPVVPIPGPSAITAVLSASGLPPDRFVFEGFLPARQKERQHRLEALRREARTLVFYEAPHRIHETLTDVAAILGDRAAVLARETTKLHEEFLRGKISDLQRQIAKRQHIGEVTLVVGGSAGEPAISEDQIRGEIRVLREQGMRVKEIAVVLGEKYGYSKKAIYKLTLEGG
jgi:16S rRNA (cytidine1402-2'-O)-methyltransferase